jgi:chaperonin GroEL (HSP60 family)
MPSIHSIAPASRAPREYLASVTAQAVAFDPRALPRLKKAASTGSAQFDCGYISPFFVTDPMRMEVAFENVCILIHEKTISSRMDLLPLLKQIENSGRPLLIIASDVEGEALATLVVKKLRGFLQVVAVRVPGVEDQRKNILQGIALLTGSNVILEGQLRNLQICDLGWASKITISENSTIVEGAILPVLPPEILQLPAASS